MAKGVVCGQSPTIVSEEKYIPTSITNDMGKSITIDFGMNISTAQLREYKGYLRVFYNLGIFPREVEIVSHVILNNTTIKFITSDFTEAGGTSKIVVSFFSDLGKIGSVPSFITFFKATGLDWTQTFVEFMPDYAMVKSDAEVSFISFNDGGVSKIDYLNESKFSLSDNFVLNLNTSNDFDVKLLLNNIDYSFTTNK